MNILTLDFESAYGKHPETGENISLPRLTTEGYVRHEKFKPLLVGLKVNDQPAYWVGEQDLRTELEAIDWGNTACLMHHAHFDAAILNWIYGLRPRFILDTLSMANAAFPWMSSSLGRLAKHFGLPDKGTELTNTRGKWSLTREEEIALGKYCVHDVELTYQIFLLLRDGFPKDELKLIDMTVRMFTEPVIEVEPSALVDDYRRELKSKRDLIRSCVGDKEQLSSADKFADLLIELGVDPPKKLSPSKVKDGRVDPDKAGSPPVGKLPSFKARAGMSAEERAEIKEEGRLYPWAYAFGKADEVFKQLLDHPDVKVRAVVEARLGVKSTIRETRSKRFYKIGTRGAFPVYLRYYGAHTGRWSGGDKQNPQNLNRYDPRDPTSGALRRSWVAPKGHVFVVCDLSQIEARMLAYIAEQEDLLEAFRKKIDPYCYMASILYGVPVDKKDKPKRMVGKASTLGCGYSMGWLKFQESLRVGFLGMDPIIFDMQFVKALDIDVTAVLKQSLYGGGTVFEAAMKVKPIQVSQRDHLIHCAVVKTIVDRYRIANNDIVRFWKTCQNVLNRIVMRTPMTFGRDGLLYTTSNGIALLNGMSIQYHQLRKENRNLRYLSNEKKKEYVDIYGGKCTENIVQGLSRIVIGEQMLTLAPDMRIVSTTHDEIITIAREQDAEDTYDRMSEVMTIPPDWAPDLPLAAEGGFHECYGLCEK